MEMQKDTWKKQRQSPIKHITERRNTMKKIISICLTAVMMLAALSACANPPGEGSTTVKKPPAAASQSGKVTEASQPVDLSVLTEDEMGKIDAGLLEKLKAANKNDIFSVTLFLVTPLNNTEFDNLVSEKLNSRATTAADKEIEALLKILDDENASIEEKDAASKRITDIKKTTPEVKGRHTIAVNEVINEYYAPVLESFIEDYKIEVPYDCLKTALGMMIGPAPATAQLIIDMAKDERLECVQISSAHYTEIYAELEEHEKSKNNTAEPRKSVARSSEIYSQSKANEIYDIIDGEIAV